MVGTWNILQFLAQRIHRIVYGETLPRVLVIVVYHGLACQFRHTHNAICIIHTVFLDAINCRIDISTRAVKVCSMDVNAQWLSTHLLSVYSSRISEPVVSMNYIKFLLSRHDTCYYRIVIYLLVQILRIASRKLQTAEVIHIHIVKIGIYMFPEREIKIGIHDVSHTSVHVVIINITPCDRHGIHC